MSDSRAGSYREKYLSALDDQERIEKQYSLQLELLKKTLFQVGAAASGMDQGLDASLLRLREVMRGGSGQQAVDQMDRVASSVEHFERTRSQETTKTAKAMKVLIDQYLELQIPKELRKSLQSFSSSLAKRLGNYRNYTLALEDLAKLQQLALDAASDPQASLWQRIKGGKTVALETKEVESVTKSAKQSEETPETPSNDADSTIDLETRPAPISNDSELSEDEDGYSEVASRIMSTLASLVENIEPNDVIRHRVDIVRHRIERGMDWYVLAVTLEDIRDILFLRYIKADDEITDYLNQVRVELATIRQELAHAIESDDESKTAATTFGDHVSTGVDRLRDSVEDFTDVDQLKDDVAEHINYISDALKEFRDRPESALKNQLNMLVDKVKTIEEESELAKKALEEQRHKATHDNLTGLPNREAYVERAILEVDRFKRYGHPLTMAICDIDFFKKINDGFGHQVGDKVLKLISKLISTRLRSVDFIARYGGEEFVLLLPETTEDQAFAVLDKIRNVIAKTPFKFKEDPMQITISFGICGFNKELKLEQVFELADKALYEAKNNGRNQCVIAKH
jgi:diguanylate cyclase